jgi:hypothetical protein
MGRLSRCWAAIAAGALLTTVGNMGLLAQPLLGLSAGPWLLIDTIWLLPMAVSAMAPVFQIEASSRALRGDS